MAAPRPSWLGVHMLHRLRTRVTVFAATNENRHQTGTTTRPLSNCWDEHRSVRTSANPSFSRTRFGFVISLELSQRCPLFRCRLFSRDPDQEVGEGKGPAHLQKRSLAAIVTRLAPAGSYPKSILSRRLSFSCPLNDSLTLLTRFFEGHQRLVSC
jgi:hypothetical protein